MYLSGALPSGSTRTSRQKQVTRPPDERCGVVRLALQLPHQALASAFALNRKGKPRETAAQHGNSECHGFVLRDSSFLLRIHCSNMAVSALLVSAQPTE